MSSHKERKKEMKEEEEVTKLPRLENPIDFYLIEIAIIHKIDFTKLNGAI